MTADNQASVTQADRQPRPAMSAWVTGTKTAPPTPRPICTMPVARPRSRMNHLETGTVAISAPPAGAVQPVTPSASNTPNSTAADCARAISSSPAVATAIASNIGPRGPRRSSQRPIRMPLTPLAHRRMVCAHPIACRESPSSSAIGMTNSPKLSVPLA